VVGLLFIYNHDGDYGKDFARLLEQATGKYLKVPKGVRVFVMGPEDIFYLNNIAVDIRLQRGDKKIGEQKVCSIFYPDLIERKVLLNRNQLAATLETLLSPFLVYIYKLPADSSKSGAIVYYRRPGTEVNEFVYLIDYLFHYQLVKDMAEITFRLPFAHKDASAVFAKAKKLYMSYETDSSDFEDRMKKIKYSSMGNIRRVFSDTEIGMRL
jgi:hypothetical protein